VFEKRVPRLIIGSKRGEVSWGWRKLHNEELSNSYSSSDIIRVITFIRMKWVGHVARNGRWEGRTKLWLVSLTEIIHSEDLRVDGRIILNLMSRN
jgi:hypothetical protein